MFVVKTFFTSFSFYLFFFFLFLLILSSRFKNVQYYITFLNVVKYIVFISKNAQLDILFGKYSTLGFVQCLVKHSTDS